MDFFRTRSQGSCGALRVDTGGAVESFSASRWLRGITEARRPVRLWTLGRDGACVCDSTHEACFRLIQQQQLGKSAPNPARPDMVTFVQDLFESQLRARLREVLVWESVEAVWDVMAPRFSAAALIEESRREPEWDALPEEQQKHRLRARVAEVAKHMANSQDVRDAEAMAEARLGRLSAGERDRLRGFYSADCHRQIERGLRAKYYFRMGCVEIGDADLDQASMFVQSRVFDDAEFDKLIAQFRPDDRKTFRQFLHQKIVWRCCDAIDRIKERPPVSWESLNEMGLSDPAPLRDDSVERESDLSAIRCFLKEESEWTQAVVQLWDKTGQDPMEDYYFDPVEMLREYALDRLICEYLERQDALRTLEDGLAVARVQASFALAWRSYYEVRLEIEGAQRHQTDDWGDQLIGSLGDAKTRPTVERLEEREREAAKQLQGTKEPDDIERLRTETRKLHYQVLLLKERHASRHLDSLKAENAKLSELRLPWSRSQQEIANILKPGSGRSQSAVSLGLNDFKERFQVWWRHRVNRAAQEGIKGE